MHFTTFIINAVTFAKIKSSLDERHALERALGKTREQVKQLAALIHLCPQCRRQYSPDLRAKTEEIVITSILPPLLAEADEPPPPNA